MNHQAALSVMLALASVSVGGQIAEWPTFRGDASRRGTLDASAAPGVPGLAWRFREEKLLDRRPFASSPAIVGDRVIIGGDSYRVYCLELATGKPVWGFDAKWPVFSSPAVWNGRVYVGEGLHEHTDCKLYCLDLQSGKLLWSLETKSHTESSPTVADARVYFGAGEDGLYCADAATGKMLWQHKGPHVDASPLVAEGRVYVGSGYDFEGVLCLSAADGRPLWKRAMPAPVWDAPTFAAGRLYIGIGNGTLTDEPEKPYGEVRCLDPKTGGDLWRFTDVRSSVLTSVAVRGGVAVATSRDGACYALDAATGRRLWRTDVHAPILCSPAVTRDHALFGDENGIFHCLALKDGAKVWALDTSDDVSVVVPDPRILSCPAVVGGRVVFGSSNGSVYCVEEARR